jgi:hypothetical protein
MRCPVILWVFLVLGSGLTASAVDYLPGDFYHDGIVDSNDLNLVMQNYDRTGMTFTDGDANGDGVVDVSDMDIVLTHYNYSLPQAAGPGMATVPEPCSLALMAAAALGALARLCWKRK